MILLSFQKFFLEFFILKSILFFSHKLELFIAISNPNRILVVRMFVDDQEKRSPSVPLFVFGGVVELTVSASLRVHMWFSCENK